MKYQTKLQYSNEQTDEVLKFKTYNKKINSNYKYIRKNPIYNLLSFFTYRFIATPLVWFYYKLIKKVKIYNKKALKNIKGGYFIYANHTNQFGDAFWPALICFPKKPYIVVNPNNVAIPFIGKLLRMWGALPVPDTITASKNFTNSIKYILNKNKPILIYPEAHIWPYYTKIRNFNSTSFYFPIKFNKPVFCFTTTYKLKKIGKKPKIEIYIDGPFYYNTTLPFKEQQKNLRDAVFNTMQQNCKHSNYSYFNYIKEEKND